MFSGSINNNFKEDNSMRKLSQHLKFDFASFAAGKVFMIQSVKYNTKRGCVTLDIVITEDNSNYGDSGVTNLYERFKMHLIQDTEEDDVEKYHPKEIVQVKKIGKCTVWGDYNSNLSVEAVVEVVG